MAGAKKTDKVDEEVKKIKETTDKTISQVKNKKETAEKKVAEEVAEKIDEVKKAVEKKSATRRKTAAKTKKSAAENAEKIVEEVKEVIEEKTAAAKKTTVKKIAEVFVQYGDKEIKTADLIEKAKADYVAAGNKKINAKDVKVYVKPEESMAYYVINGDFTGNFEV